MYGYLLDYPEQETVRTRVRNYLEDERSGLDTLVMTAYQKERQRVYDRAAHLAQSAGYVDRDVEDAQAEAALVRAEAQASRARGDQLGWLRHMLRRGAVARFGYRNPTEMVASRLDIDRPAARDLVYLAERLGDQQIESIRQGATSYVRVLAETRLAEAGASAEAIERSRSMDLESVKRLLQGYRRVSRTDERELFEGQHVSFQPSLDGGHVQVKGRLGPLEAEICRQGLERRGESLVPAGEGRPGAGQRRALALTTLCQDELDRSPEPARTTAETRAASTRREPALMVVVDQGLAETSGHEQGVAILGGARVGPDTADLVQCSGRTEVVAVAGESIFHHGSVGSIRPSLRRAVLARDDGCTIDGCSSTYRLEVHHITPMSKGGDHTPDNLTTLCWWHHHVAVHRRGMRIDPQSPPRRRRLLPPNPTCGYQLPEPDPHTLAVLRALRVPTNRAPP
ncbi:MAG: HNH endonuclease [bacterium]|nr:HNH endonuclease [bacterium]